MLKISFKILSQKIVTEDRRTTLVLYDDCVNIRDTRKHRCLFLLNVEQFSRLSSKPATLFPSVVLLLVVVVVVVVVSVYIIEDSGQE